MHRFVNILSLFVKFICLSHIFFVPSLFLLMHSFALNGIIFCISILLYFVFNRILMTIKSLIIKERLLSLHKSIVFCCDYVFLFLKQFFIIFFIIKFFAMYSLCGNNIYGVIGVFLLYNIIVIIVDGRTDFMLTAVLSLLVYIVFLIIVFSERNISYESLTDIMAQKMISENIFFYIIVYFVPFFLLFFDEDRMQKSTFSFLFLVIGFSKIVLLGMIFYLRNKLHVIFFAQSDTIASVIIKNYTKFPFFIHLFYLLLIALLFYVGYQTYQHQRMLCVDNRARMVMFLTIVFFTFFFVKYITSVYALYTIIYIFLFLQNVFYSVIIYQEKGISRYLFMNIFFVFCHIIFLS